MGDLGKLLLRTGAGVMMLGHGYPKLMKFFSSEEITFSDPIGLGPLPSLVLAVLAELLCAILVILGWKTRWATVPLIITMLVAAFIIHADDPWGKKELALLYAVSFAAIALLGPGKYSLDDRTGRYQNM